MASGQIKRSEIAEKDLYVEIRDSAKKTITTLNQLNVELKKSGTIIKTSLTGNLNKTTAGINKLSTAVKKAETVMAQSVKVDKAKSEAVKAQMKAEQELEKLNQAKQKTIQAELRTKTQLNKEQERQTNLKNKAIKAVKDEDNAYKRLVKTTRDQKNESKRLGAELLKLEQNGKKNTTQYRKLSTQFRNVTNSAKKGDKSLKKLDKTVGDNFRNVGNYRGALGKLSGAFASLGIAMGGAMIIKNVFGVIKDFDQAQANLASVLGVSRDQMKGLTEQSKELGATTRFTASQVSELQLEFAKLGFEQEQIEKMTGSVLDLAGATGAELGESASIVGATMRGFGLDASETQRVTDVMAKSFSSSSLDMSKFSTAMASVAPVAKLSGKSIEETTALIGTLTDRGIDASTAGTGLRNMFLKSKKAGLTFDEALEKINTSTDKSATAMELFGVRGATLGVVLAENGKDVENLTGKLKDAEGATAEMAEMQKNTLAGSLDLLQSAWEGMILSMDEAGGVGEKLRKGIRFLADNFGDIVKWVGKIVQAMIAYKTVMIAIKIANSGFVQDMIKVGKAMVQTARGTKGAITGIKGVGKAMKGIGLGVAIGLLLELAKAFYDIASGASEARRQQDLFNESQEKASELVEKILKEENERIEAQRKILELKKADKTNNFGELEFSKEMQLLEEGKLNRLERARKFREKEINDIKEQNKLLKEQAEKDLERLRSGGAGQGTGSAIRGVQLKLEQDLQKNNDLLVRKTETELQLRNAIVGSKDTIHDYSVSIVDNSAILKQSNAEIKENVDNLDKQANSTKALENEQSKRSTITLVDTTKQQLERNVLEAEYNILLNETNWTEEEKINLLTRQILAQAELEKYGKSKAEQQVIDLRALKQINALTTENVEETKNMVDQQVEFVQSLTKAFNYFADKRIKKIDEEIKKAEERQNRYAELAKAGNINAQQSFAVEAKLIAEQNRRKEKLEKQKQRVQLASDATVAYIRNAEDPDVKNPLLKTFSDITLLTQFIQNLPFFESGTEDTGKTGNGIDGKGGFLSVLHPNERVMTKQQNAMIGDISNDELAKVASLHRSGEMLNGSGAVQIESGWNTKEVVKRLESLENTLKNKPETNIQFERIIDGAMQIVRETKQGNTKVYNRYRV